MKRAPVYAAAVLAFVVLATANSGGYRFGTSDQAFYVPAVAHILDPALFPRDGAMLDAQSRLMATDDVLAAAVDLSGQPIERVALVGYLLSLVALSLATIIFGRSLGWSSWTLAAFGLLLTFRHRIARTGANSLEGYMHPRQLAFAAGVASLACLVRGHLPASGLLVLLAGVIHPTTGLWFAVVLGAGLLVSRPAWRRGLLAGGSLAALAALWAVTAGPLAGRLGSMDEPWLAVLASKDYLFPTQWPLSAWALNLLYPLVIAGTWTARRRLGVASRGEAALVAGAAALTGLFLVSVPLTAMEVALAVQLQISRVFWVLDFVALGYVAWWLTRTPRAATIAVALLAVASAGRGSYLLEYEHPERRLVTATLPDSDWTDVMRWLATQPPDWHVLADPDHAWKYGSSVRVAAGRDTVLEVVKDSAISLYDREIAMRVAARINDLVDFPRLSPARVAALDAAYDLDVGVVEAGVPLDRPVLYRNAGFIVYDLR